MDLGPLEGGARHRRIAGNRPRDRRGAGRRGRARRGVARARASASRRPRRRSARRAFVLRQRGPRRGRPALLAGVDAAARRPVEILVTQQRRAARGPDPLAFTPRAVGGAPTGSLLLAPITLIERARARACASAAGAGSSGVVESSVREPIGDDRALQRPPAALLATFKTIAALGRGRRRDAQHAAAGPDRDRARVLAAPAAARRRSGWRPRRAGRARRAGRGDGGGGGVPVLERA